MKLSTATFGVTERMAVIFTFIFEDLKSSDESVTELTTAGAVLLVKQ